MPILSDKYMGEFFSVPVERVADGVPPVPLTEVPVLQNAAGVLLRSPAVGCPRNSQPSFWHDYGVVVADGQIRCPCAVPECCNQIPQSFVAQSGH